MRPGPARANDGPQLRSPAHPSAADGDADADADAVSFPLIPLGLAALHRLAIALDRVSLPVIELVVTRSRFYRVSLVLFIILSFFFV